MSRIERRFENLKKQGRKALIPYITAGDPSPGITVPMLHKLIEAGADVIELGVPFSDPMADGPVIQQACERALAHGMSLRRVLQMVREFRDRDQETPVVLMGYMNPIEAMGLVKFIETAVEAGVDGVLIVDLPPEEARELTTSLSRAGIDPIFLLAPTSSRERIEQVAGLARGYVYYVSLKGVTGAATLNAAEVGEKISAIRELVYIPIGVGFGIKDAAAAAAIARMADAVVVGSAIVSLMGRLADDPVRMQSEVTALVSSMRQAMDAAAD